MRTVARPVAPTQAIGDETLTVALALTAADGASAGATPNAEPQTVVPRDRSLLGLALIGGALLVIFLIGASLIVFAERFGRPPRPAAS